ncbi:MAG: DUF4236 domain-containing protein [Peptostreptococcus sp.]|uniref:DUF4236 domain-containing protein n=1 Tax=Peptostreptococcus sp. TaxID=1262 RepID=UPI002FCBD44C
MRFKKSKSICKGSEIDFSNSGASFSFGVQEIAIDVNEQGMCLGIAIPDSSVYNRHNNSARSKNNKEKDEDIPRYNIRVDESGDVAFYGDSGLDIIDESLKEKIKRTQLYSYEKNRQMKINYERINAETEKFLEIYKLSPNIKDEEYFKARLDSLSLKTYKRESFKKKEPTINDAIKSLKREAKQEISSWRPLKCWIMRREYIEQNKEDKLTELNIEWQGEKIKFEEEENRIESQRNTMYIQEYYEEKKSLEMTIKGDKKYIEEKTGQWLETTILPLDFELAYEYRKSSLFVDINLPEIEKIPEFKAVKLSNGAFRREDKNTLDLREEYINCVFGLAVFFSSNLFNISPCIKNIVMSACTKRKVEAKSQSDNEYIYSIKFNRNGFVGKNMSQVDPYEFCMGFENRCNINNEKYMEKIKPY